MTVMRVVLTWVKMGILIITLFPFYVSASSYLKCIGIVTLKDVFPKDSIKKVVPNGKERFIIADIFIHSHTFSCQGHSASLPVGLLKMVKLSLTPNIDITPKQGDHFNVLYQYYDSVAPPPENFIRNSRWTVNRRESSVPSVRESSVPSVRESDKIVEVNVNKDASPLKDEEVRVLNSKLKTYTGSYFEVKYPSNFIAKPTVPIERYNISEDDELNLLDSQTKLLSDSSEFIRTDEAYFSSPDGLVEFFVYSPQWDGRPKNYLDVLKGEKLLSSEYQKDIKVGVHHDYIQTRWVTIQANNGSYVRSYVQQRACHGKYFNDCISHVFGIKYKDKKRYKNYRNFYIAFKESLVQSVD